MIEGSNAIVTGSSRGIGKSIALELAARGANVVVCCQSRLDAAREVREIIEERGGRAVIAQADLATEGGAAAVVGRCVEEFGGVDILVNNAGMGQLSPIQDLEDSDLERTLRVNLFSYFYMAKHAVGDMIRRGSGGCVVNISSILGMIGGPGQTAYAASKGGITAFTVCLAREVARHGIRVNAIAPGYIETELISWMPEDYRAKIVPRIPMRRFGTGEEVARAAAFLIEDATYMTGQTLIIDGGIMID
ncbi:MAG: 3-oxoacyl-ACP reductase FabG [Actinobacteria bacterium]|nr:3-oxoacyl-ACP reductase FabG [Actinomycetota bacterium]